MLALAAAGAPEGSWLRADRQTGGRGRLGRIWLSPPGNFYGSTIVRLRAGDPQAATLALVAAVAVEEVVRLLLAERAGGLAIKWPNDLLLDGAKLSGILLERAGDAVVIGVGVNLADHPRDLDRPTTSLAAHGVPVAPETLQDMLVEAMARWLGRWRGEGLSVIRHRWLDRAQPVGSALAATLPGGERIDGLFDGIDGEGALLLRLASGERRVIHAGDVTAI